MLPHSAPALLVTMIASLTAVVAGLSPVCMLAVFRAQGRRAVEAELARRGETAVSIEQSLRILGMTGAAGLAVMAQVFRVNARTADGAPTTYFWAYEPGLIKAVGAPGLKRLAHGIWIPA